jgi:hypothetical protein
MATTPTERENQRQAALVADLLKLHRAVGRALQGATLVGPGSWRFEEMTFGAVIAAYEEADANPAMPMRTPAPAR